MSSQLIRPSRGAVRAGRGARPLRTPWEPLLTIAVIVALWELIARTYGHHGLLFPSLEQVARSLVDDRSIWLPALGSTAVTSLKGLLAGLAVAAALTLIVAVIGVLERPLLRQLTVLYCLPLVTIVPLLYIMMDEMTVRVTMAAIGVVFPVFVALVQGLHADKDTWRDVIATLGPRPWTYLLKVRTWALLPQLSAALRIAAAAAVLGATLAEYFGGTGGLGAVMITSLANLDGPRLYALGMLVTALGASGYLLVGLLTKLMVPWVGEMSDG